MRDYATVSPQFWLGKTGRDLRKAGAEAQIVAFYLMTSPHSNMLGLYYLPVLYLAHETGLGLEGASKGLERAIEAGFCSYDEATEMIWVHEMAAYQVGRALKPGDNKCAGVRNCYSALPENPFLSVFYERYKDDFHLNFKRGNERGMKGAKEGLRSQEQEQDQDQEQKNTLDHGRSSKNKYTADFEKAWELYPKRAGGNSKAEAFKAWTEQIHLGVEVSDLVSGVKRYANYISATKKTNTQFVKQAKIFFGAGEHYLESWEVPSEFKSLADSNYDYDIPPGWNQGFNKNNGENDG